LFIALVPILSIFPPFTKPVSAQTTSSFTCNNIYVSVQAPPTALTNNYPVGKKFYQLDWTTGTLGAQIGTIDATGVTGGIGVDPKTNLLYYVDGNGGSGYGGVGRIWYFDGKTHTNTGHTIADPTAEHQAGMDVDGVLWATKWTGTKDLYRYDKTVNAISQGSITVPVGSPTSLANEWMSLSEGDLIFDKDNKIWFVSTSSGQISIWTISTSTRIATKVGNYASLTGTNHVVTGGAFGPDGKLYIGTSFGHIYKFDTTANTLSAVNTTTGSIITDMTSCMYPAMNISGKVWNDADNSANNTFTNINTGAETGTNAGGLNAILIDANGKVIASASVAATGLYSFPNISGNQSGLKIRLSTTAGTVGGTAPVASVPASWVNTSPLETAAFTSTITTDVTGKDFGVQPKSIAGRVFEDINYGGGAGRDYPTANNSAVSSGWTSGAIGSGSATAAQSTVVELYADNGAGTVTKVQETATDNNGNYSFPVTSGTYRVRVVNSTVRSERTGYTYTTHLPVQTYRNDPDATTPAITNEVGGRNPAGIDSGTQSMGASFPSIAQSWTDLVVGTANISGVDFGYNFDTIVNTNDSGQGSLRQFIINSNALTNTGLAQVGQTAGNETSIFTISDGAIHNGLAAGLTNQLSSYGAAVITLTSTLPTITDSNTIIDGATQTANIGDTNAGTLGTGNTVGTDAIPLALFKRPEVEIAGGQGVLTATGDGDQIKNIAANLHLSVSGKNSLVQDNLVGMSANGTIATALKATYGITAGSGTGITVRHNYVRVNNSGIRTDGSGAGLLIEFNEVDAPLSNQTDTFEGILLIHAGSGYTIQKNLISNMRGAGTELSFGGVLTNTLLENNTYMHNGYLDRGGTVTSTEPMGIVAYNAGAGNQITISKNIITQSAGPGIVVMSSQGVQMTQNSLFANGIVGTAGLGIDLDPISRDPNGYLSNGGVANGVTANGTAAVASTNNGMNYPVITSSKLNSGQLTVKGFVGSVASSNAFTGANVEVFIAANDGNQNGAVIFADGRIKSHGEGKTYLPPDTACKTDSNSKFSCTFSTAGARGLTDPNQITATATDSSGNTSEFSASPYAPANVQILKRITGIKSAGGSYGTTNPNNTAISLNTPDNTNPSFPTNYVTGLINAGIVKPGDEIEYTIYYVNNGENAAKLKVCDLLSPNLVFNPNGFDTGTNTARGIQLQLGQNTPVLLTSANDSTVDRAYYASGAPGTTISGCNLGGNTTTTTTTNASGTVVIDINSASDSDTSAPILLTIPGTVGSTIPNDSYGLVKFRAKVKN
jgi:trimeric autotransporter adhesin